LNAGWLNARSVIFLLDKRLPKVTRKRTKKPQFRGAALMKRLKRIETIVLYSEFNILSGYFIFRAIRAALLTTTKIFDEQSVFSMTSGF
jgi:hypothetical protein